MKASNDLKVDLQGSRSGLQPLKSMETSPGSLKKPTMKFKAAGAVRSVLNLLNITDRRKESLTEKTAATIVQSTITGHMPSKLSSVQTLDPTVDWLLDDKEYKDSLSKTWSYFIRDPNEVRGLNEVSDASDCENSMENQKMCRSLGSSDGLYQPEHYRNDSEDMNENSTLVQRSAASRIIMGVSVLQGINTTKPYDPKMSCLELNHHCESSQSQPASLSAISTDPQFGEDTSSKTRFFLSNSSPVPKGSFCGVESGICNEIPDPENHISFPSFKPAHSSNVTKLGLQPVDESSSSKNFMTASSSHIHLVSPKNVASVSKLQEIRDESHPTGQGYASNFKGQQFPASQISLLFSEVTQHSNSTDSEAQLVSNSTKCINIMKCPVKEICLQTARLPPSASNISVRVFSNESAHTSQQFLVSQCLNDSLNDPVVPVSKNCSTSVYSKRHLSVLAVENNSMPGVGEIPTKVSSFHTAATADICSQRNRCLPLDYSASSFSLVAEESPQFTVQNPKNIAAVSTAITIGTSALNTTGHVPVAAGAVRQLGSQRKSCILLPKTARRCLHGHLKHQLPYSSLESNSMPKRAKTLERGTYKPLSVSSASSFYSKTAVDVECKTLNLDYNCPIATEASGSSYSHKPAKYPLMNAVLKQRTLIDSDKRPSNASLRNTDVCSLHPSKLPETDMNGNYIADTLVLSPQTKQLLTPGYVIPCPLSTSSPVIHKRRLSCKQKVLPTLQDFVSPVRHNPKSEACRALPENSNAKRTRRQRHRNNRLNRFSVYRNGNVDTSSDQEKGFVSQRSIDYILLLRTANLIVNRIPFKKEIKSFINMGSLMEYLQTYFLSEMSKTPDRNIWTISEYRSLKAKTCQQFTCDRLTYETCLSELLDSFLVNEPRVVQICSDFIFEHLRFLASCPDFYNMPPELFLMLLSNNKSIVLGYHGFPLPYDESVRQVQRAGRKYIGAHGTGGAERDSRLENMLSVVIDQTVALNSSHSCHDKGKKKFTNSYHEIKYRQSEQFVTAKGISQYGFFPDLSLTATGSLRGDPEGGCSDPVSYGKYCSNAYILRRIYFSYIIQDQVPYISQIRQQYAVQGRKVTYSIGNSTSKSGLLCSERPVNPDHNWADSYPLCTTAACNSSHKVAAVPRSDPLLTDKSPATDVEGDGLTTEPAGLKMSTVQLARGEHITGVMLQGDSALHNLMVITNKGRYIRAHGNVEFPGNTDWTLVPPPEEPQYCLQAVVANTRSAASQTYLQSVRVVWSVLSCFQEHSN